MGKTKNSKNISNGDRINVSKKYWENKILPDMGHTRLSYDYNNKKDYQINCLEFNIHEKSNESILKMTKNKNMLIYSILVSIFSVELSKYTFKDEVIIGIPMYGNYNEEKTRNYDIVLPLISNINKGTIIKEHIKNTHSSILEVYKHQFYSIRKIMTLLDIGEELSNICVMYESLHDGQLIDKIINSKEYDITIVFKNNNDKISGVINYNTKRYRETTIKRLVEHFKMLLNNAFVNINCEINNIEMFSEEEKNKLLFDFNDTNVEYPKDKTIQELFEKQVEKNPDKVALVHEDKKMTYKELNEGSNQLARRLREKGVKQDVLVGIIVEQSFEMFVGIMAVLKAGGAYLPIDPKYPENRITYMLEDSNAKVILTKSSFINNSDEVKKLINSNRILINLEDSKLYHEDKSNLDNERISCSSNDLAYVIYTSGSTGKPKGVMVENRSLVNLCYWHNKEFNITPKDKATKYAGVGFDASVWEIFPYLIKGAEIHIIHDDIRLDANKLNEYFEENNITMSFLPTQMCEQFMDIENTSLRKLLTGGDKLRKYKDSNYDLVNNYGPTECTVVTTSFTIDKNYNNLPIGKPISNASVYILGNDDNLVPIGVAGELCISGDGLARGYLNRPDLTEKMFVENPFIKGKKMYRTGDLVRWLPKGDIEFLGRIDNQVQIRGFRVELGEIENTILKHKHIKEAVVVDREDELGNKYLCGYIIANSKTREMGTELNREMIIDIAKLKEYLSKELPDYMIPSYFVEIEEVPLTTNGKVDKKALPKPDLTLMKSTEYIAPRDEIEEKIVEIIKDVLNINIEIGMKDNFFDMGGHSLTATKLVSKIHKELGVEIPLMKVFKLKTLEEIAEVVRTSDRTIYNAIQPVEKREYYPMSSAQKRMYIINQMDKETTTYNMPALLKITGELDKTKLKKTFLELIKRHESLRTSFISIEDELVQQIKTESDIEFKIDFEELSHSYLEGKEKEELLNKKALEFIRPFDLEGESLFRVGVIEVSEREHLLMVDMHHIISDGVSIAIIIEEFTKLYAGEELDPLNLQYKDYAIWQKELFESGKIKEQEEYWVERFRGEIPVLDLKTDYKRPTVQNYKGASKDFVINKNITRELKNIANETGTTLYMVLLSAINILLQKHTGQEDIVIGSPIAGRPHNDLSSIVGMFVNTLAMRNYPKSQMSFKEFLEDVKENSLNAYDNQDVQFEELVEKLNIERDMSRNPLFDVMFVLQNTGVDENKLKLDDLELSTYDLENKVAQFDITITAIEIDEKITLNFNYATSLFKESTIERLGKHFINILEELLRDKSIKLKDIDILSEMEKHQLMVEFNQTHADYSKDKMIHELFEEQVKKTPDNVALVFDGEELTYRELNQRSNQMARELLENGANHNTTVGIIVEKSFEMIIGIIGVLKCGGTYLPIDPTYPEDRVKYMLENAKSTHLLTQEKYVNEAMEKYKGIKILNLNNKKIYIRDKDNLGLKTNLDDSVYIIYTSGSTGRPKGVKIQIRNILNVLNWYKNRYDFNELDRHMLSANYVFDPSIEHIFVTLTSGARLYIVDELILSSNERFNEFIKEEKITFADFTPMLMDMLLTEPNENNSVRVVISGGEKLSKDIKNRVLDLGYNLNNHYGLTETTIDNIVIKAEKDIELLGKPIDNTKIYIIDSNNKLQPIGVAGELCITGDGVAEGYLNNVELTKERFVDNPFISEEKMYKTGDLARWLDDGNLEFLGRIDNQVKIRGFRIELGEIESKLQNLSQIKDAIVVIVGEESDKLICAYIIRKESLDIDNIRGELSKSLPDYMIPSYFVEIDNIPLTINGKVDKKALPKPDISMLNKVEYVAPRNEMEENLVKIFKDVLDTEIQIGIKDNFFELGGHSLKATKLVSRIHKNFDVQVSLMEIFKSPTVEKIAELVNVLDKNIYNGIKPVEKRAYYPMSSAQKRMYIINQMDKKTITYNMPSVLKVIGQLDKDKLEKIFINLIKRHESLRTAFTSIEDNLVQQIKEISEIEFKIEYEDVSQENVQLVEQEKIFKNRIDGFIRPFDLEKGCLLRVKIIKILENEHILLVDMHHIISDGVSTEIVIEEFTKLYKEEELEPLNIQYKDYAVWQKELFESGQVKEQEKYWLETFKGEIPVLNLLTDYPRPIIRSKEGATKSYEINEKLTKELKRIANETGTTLYMVLLSAFNVLLQKHAGQEDIVIGSPIAGRPHNDLSNIVGMFVNTLAMRNYPRATKKFSEFLAEVKENSLKAYDNQDIQFEELVEKLPIDRDMSRNPLFDVMFVLQNTGVDEKNLILDGLELAPYNLENRVSKFDITLTGIETNTGILLNINYATKLFKESTIERFANHLIRVIEEISKDKDIKLKDIDILTEKEKHKLLIEFNDTKVEYPKNKTIQELFEEQVKNSSEEVAIVFEEKELSYKELNERSNQVARKLRGMNIKPNDLVGIMIDRSLDMIVGIMGILKSGGAYLPIDPNYPQERISYMLQNAEVNMILTQGKYKKEIEINYPSIRAVNLEDKGIYEGNKDNLDNINSPNDLSYVIYTSGSTGNPKGVMIEHKNVVNLVQNLSTNVISNTENRLNVALLSPYVFDASVKLIFTPLINGHKLFIASESIRTNGKEIVKFYNDNNIQVSDGTPIHLKLIGNELDMDENLNVPVEQYLIGGEELSILDARRIIERNEKTEIINVYGPTECSVDSTYYKINRGNLSELRNIPIGKPLDNYKAYVLGQENELQAIGVAGELCIAGTGVARGYLNNEELTEKKFVQNPFNANEKMYRTGDLVRWLNDGNIEFIGRIDNQVKIRGFRIELGEIESQLKELNQINDAVVVVVGKGDDKAIWGYIVCDNDIKISQLKEELSNSLPDYMIPTYFMKIDSIPLTTNGKVDRKALPKPDGKISTGVEYIAPRNKVEEELVSIFKDVLNIENEISIKDNFFDLGGHSLKATTLVSRIHKELGIEVSLMEVFKSPTVEKLATLVNKADKTIYKEIKTLDKREYYPMSSAQRRMYIINQLDNNSTTYNMPSIKVLKGELDLSRIEDVFRKLISRHESLRTSFVNINDELVQKIKEESEFEFSVDFENISELNLNVDEHKDIIQKKIKEFIRPFDLENGCLLRIGIIKISGNENLLMVDMHHIISDGISMGIVIEDFIKLYEGEELEPLNIQYKDYAVWQNELFESGKIKEQEKYWLEKFEGEIPVLDLKIDYKRPVVQSYEGSSKNFVINKQSTKELKDIANETGTTLYMVMLSAINVLLQKYTGQEDIVIGSPIAGRSHNDLSNIVGMFVNTLAMRNQPKANKQFIEFLKEVKENSLKAYDNQDVQFEELVEKLNIQRDMSRNPLFDIMFVLQNTGIDENDISLNGLEVADYDLTNEIAKFDITITAMEKDEEILVNFNYATSLFKDSTIDRLGQHFVNLLKDIIKNKEVKIQDIDILSEKEKHQLLVEFNDTNAEYPKDKTIQEIFEEQVEKYPNKVALVFNEEELTYRELNERSNQLARKLRENGVKKDALVAIIVEQSFDMFIGIMAVLKAGGGYLPIDPKYPENRITYMLEDSNAKVILMKSSFINNSDKFKKLIDSNSTMINLEDDMLYHENKSNLDKERISWSSNDLAYVIYTSGSTGKPKGVMVEHKSLVNLSYWHNQEFKVTSNDKATKYAGVGFDASVWEIFPYLIKGAEIHIIHDDIRLDVNKLNQYFEENKITISFLPTQMCEQFISIENTSLRKLLTGGDKLKLYKDSNYDLVNNYGPTECTVVTTSFTIDKEYNNLPIGKPISNAEVYILGKDDSLVPVGVAGELCISGDGLARGYLNRPDLTEKMFVENPFIPDKKMYRTGDLVRWLTNGNIEFLGRIDNQVQIRGFRVELGEIENTILNHKHIKEAVVVDREDKFGNKYLCGYIVANNETRDIDRLKEQLREELPDYMIPSYFVEIEEIPLTTNGKVNKKALPKPDLSLMTSTEYMPPRNEDEQKLVRVFKETLNLEVEIGIKDNFFELGGHSLNASKLVSKIHKEFDVKVPLMEVFKRPTVERLVELVKTLDKTIYDAIEPVEEREYYPMSSPQKRMYIINRMDKEVTSYNMPIILKLSGELDIVRLEKAFKQLVQRHESLRTSFEMIEDKLVQRIMDKDDIDLRLEYKDVSKLILEVDDEEKILKDRVEAFIRPFDLEKGCLFRVGVTKVSEKEHLLIIDMHHIISDGVSMGIVVEEFVKLYKGEKLQPLTIQYKDFSVWQNKMFESDKKIEQEKYWIEKFEGEIPVLNLSTDFPRPSVQSFEGNNFSFTVDKDIKDKLQEISKTNGATLYMTLLAAYNTLLYKYTGQEDIVVGSPIAGRHHAELNNIIGMFVNTLPMRNNPEGNKTFIEFLTEVKENALKAYRNQNYQFEELVEKLDISKDTSRNPLFDTMFVLQNMDIGTVDLSELKISPYDFENHTSKFDILLSSVEQEDGILLNLEYSTKLFKKETMERFRDHFINILKKIVINPDTKLSEIDMITDEEEKILYEFNKTEKEYPRDKTVHRLFEEQAEKTPDNIAVVYKDDKLTYKELNEKANRLARTLRNKGIKSDNIVGIMVEKSVEMIVGILAILKAGSGYLPIDPKLPKERKLLMLEDSQAKMLLVKEEISGDLNNGFDKEIINLSNEEIYSDNDNNLEDIANTNNLLYSIYTSGTTGKPKGVMLEHRTLVNLVNFELNNTSIDLKGRKITQFAAMSFDVCYQEIFSSLLGGGELYIVNDDLKKDIDIFLEFIEEKQIDIVFLPTAYFKYMSKHQRYMEKLSTNIKHIVVAGEQLVISATMKKCLREKQIHLHNHYGPSETHVVTTLELSYLEDIAEIPTIGKPIDNTEILILDQGNKLQPIGVPGELCISGDCLGRGYLNREDLTKEKFVAHPFKTGEKMYKTGDLARWLADGNIEFLGRIDHQVKIRGYRIELGEIESQILDLPEIKEAVVTVVGEESAKAICAYVVTDSELSLSDLREKLLRSLPEYMVPTYFVEIEEIPVTTNGKVDKKALPKPDVTAMTSTDYIAPRNEIEEKLVEIFKDVLNTEIEIGIKDNFFKLGGHSLKATELVSKIHKEFNVEISLMNIFKLPTVERLGELVKTLDKTIYNGIKPVEEREYYPMSSAQKRMYIINQMDKETTTYNMPAILKLTGELDKTKLEKTFIELIGRHETVRTSFLSVEDELVQKVREISEVEFKVDYQDISKLNLNLQEQGKILDEKVKEFIRPFNLKEDLLIRVGLIEIIENEYLLMVDMHHIISDGVSIGIVIQEFTKLYNEEELEPLNIGYKDYAVWQNELFESGKIEEQEQYWMEKFEGEIPVLDLKTDYSRPVIQSHKGSSKDFVINANLTKELKNIANETGTTLYMVLLSAINVLLQRYTGQEDIVIGSPIAGRPHNDLSNIVGMFVNILAMRNYPKFNKRFGEFLEEVKENSLNAYSNQDIQFEELVEKLNIERDMSRNPLFDVMFVLQNTGTNEKNLNLNGLEITDYDLKNEIAKFDITITVEESNEEILVFFNYATSLFKENTIERLGQHLINVLEEISKDKNVEIQNIDILSEKEKHKLLVEFNETKAEYPYDKTIHELFEEKVKKYPNKIALVLEEKEMTYEELNRKSNQVARRLRQEGITPDTLVGIMVDRSFEMIVGMLGILKAGGVYVPIDPQYPVDRINYMIEDSNINVLLTNTRLLNNQDIDFKGETIDLEDDEIYTLNPENLEIVNNPNNLAYIIYTSGTTGRPKGVMIEHKNVTRLMLNDRYLFEFSNEDVWTMFHSYCFDFSVWEMYGALLYGGKLVIVPKIVAKSPKAFLEILKKEKVTVLNQTPSAFYNLANEEIKELDKELQIRYVIFGGEALKPANLKTWKEKYPKTKLINMYGITETTVHVTFKEITDKEIAMNISNIGKPIPTLKTYVMDKNLRLLPIGVAGELCVGGKGVARGYLNRPDLTEEKFVANPYRIEEKIYRSGDLVRILDNGEMEYLGRIDNQVKIRGFRIELGEIESQLQKISNIKEGIVTVVGDEEDKAICGYIVHKESESSLNISEIKEKLSITLPGYMIPTYFVEIEELPLTANGKVNKKALPKPDLYIMKDAEFVPPRDEIEEKLVKVFKETLNLEVEIGIKDNFFELGGHSLNATKLVSRIHKEFDVEVPLIEVFKLTTAEKLGELIKSLEKTIYDAIKPVEEREYYPMSSAQKRMYIINQMDKETTTYNLPAILKLTGKLDIERLENTFIELIKRHESLRTSFKMLGEEFVQKVEEKIDFQVDFKDISTLGLNLEEREELLKENVLEFVRPFDLEGQCLFRVGLIKILENEHLLMVDMHHIISDGVSMGIVIDEFGKLYEGKVIEPLNIQYKDYAVWQKELFESGKIEEEEKYWLERFEGEIPVLDLLTDYKRPAVQRYNGASIDLVINDKLTKGLKHIANTTGATMYIVLLSILNVLLQKHTGQEDIVIGSPIAGRPHNDLSNLVGMFVNTLAMRNYPKNDMKFSEFLEEVKENSLRAYDNQDVQFEELIEKLPIKKDTSRNPLFDIMFVLQNTYDGTKNMEIEGLEFEGYDIETEVAKFDMTITAIEENNEILVEFNYATSLYKESTIDRLVYHFESIIKEITEDRNIKIQDIDILSAKEKQKLLEDFNNTKAEYPKDKTIQEIFEEQVEKHPDKVALVFEDKEMTYSELNNHSNQIARLLKNKGVKPDDLVAIMLERSFEMIIGIMGILKSGGAYLPIDPSYPKDRIAYMLKDSKAKLLITKADSDIKGINDDILERKQKTILNGVNFNIEIIGLVNEDSKSEDIKDSSKEINNLDNVNLEIINKPNDLAYIIYTSGSTGKPKGVMIEHKSVLNTLYALEKEYPVKENDAYLLKTAFTFDVSVTELFGWFIGNGKLVILKQGDEKDPKAIYETIKKNKVSHINFAPSTLNMFINAVDKDSLRQLDKLKYIMVAGEAFSKDLAEKSEEIFNNMSNLKVENIYGPTETTIYATKFSLLDLGDKINVPIGQPINNVRTYVLDTDNNLTPIGVAGELCIAGEGLARGYLNRQALTEEKFVKNPFNIEEKMYRSGDLVRWLPDGNIEFLGRIDNQVKIRGFRIELGEIENQISKLPQIKECVVTVVGEGTEKSICGYIVYVDSNQQRDISEIREELLNTLPDYMIPSYFVQIDEVPLTSNGKINKKALPDYKENSIRATEYVSASNNIEEELVEIWKNVLSIENIGIHDNFFEIGGHSIKAMQIINSINEKLNVEVSLIELYKRPNIKELAKLIQGKEGNSYKKITKVPQRDFYKLSYNQKRLWLVNQLESQSSAYNMVMKETLNYEVDVERLKSVFKKLVMRHESLRTGIKTVEGEPVQFIMEYIELPLNIVDISKETSEEKKKIRIEKYNEENNYLFKLEDVPLFRIVLIKVSDKEYDLIVNMHHIISDGYSIEVVKREFEYYYNQDQGETVSLEPLEIQYKDYAVWQNELVENENIKTEYIDYWLKKVGKEVPKLNLPTTNQDFIIDGGKIVDKSSSRYTYYIKEEVYEGLSKLAKDNNTTLFMVMFSVYNMVLARITNQNDITALLPSAGRENSQLQKVIGFFVNSVIVKNEVKEDEKYIDFLARVNEDTLNFFKYQSYPLEVLVEELDMTYPRASIFFNMLNLDDSGKNSPIQSFEPIHSENISEAKSEIAMYVMERKNGIELNVHYWNKLFTNETIVHILSEYEKMLLFFSKNPESSYNDYKMIKKKKRRVKRR